MPETSADATSPDALAERAALARGPLAFMARNSVAANLLMVALVAGGLMMLKNVRQEVFPDSAPDVVTVNVAYPGASPEEVEQGIVLAIEEALSGVDGIKEMTATAAEGNGRVSVEVMRGSDKDVVLSDVQAAVDRVTSFPQDAERPSVATASRRRETLSLIFYGEAGERELRNVAQLARDQLLQDPRITDVEVTEVRPLEISIEAPEASLREHGLTLPQIATIVRNASVELPAGSVDTASGEVLLRTDERRDLGDEFADIVLLGNPDGSEVRVGDVANVVDGFKDTDTAATFNGLPAARVRVYRAGDQTPIELSEAVYDYLAEAEGSLPPGVSAEIWFDRSEAYRDRINLLLKNAYLGLILVLLVLGLFLDVRLAFWVTLGIPISFLGAIVLMPSLDVSFNMISLFAFMLTLGIVVDDAIVVGESVYHQRTLGKRGVEAAILGVKEVAAPVVFSVLTTMIAFVPMLIVPGTMGRFIRVIPLIVLAVFLLSLIESLLILPAHLAHASDARAPGLLGLVQRAQRSFSRGFDWFVDNVYAPSLRPTVHARYLTITVSVGLIVFCVGLVKAGHVKVTFMPRVESDVVSATLRMPFGTPSEQTSAILSRIVDASEELLEEHGGQSETARGIYASVGSGAVSFGPGGGGPSGAHVGSVSVNLVPMDERDFTATDFARQWREAIGPVAGAELLSFRFSTGPSGGAAISVELSHSDVPTLEATAERVADHLRTFAGVSDIDSGVSPGKEQLDFTLTREGRALGLTEADLARQLRSAFFGAEAIRQQRGRDEIRVYVRRPESERESEYFLETMMVRLPNGGEMPLAEAAHVSRGRAYTSISRINGRRVLTVTADVDEDVANAAEINSALRSDFMPGVADDVPGLTFDFSGEDRSRRESIGAMFKGFIYALFAMFGLMAVAFRSYIQPVIILSAIPFGIVGAILGHVVMGYSVSLMSVFGIVALSGVVVNDSLLLVTSINRFAEQGRSPFEAAVLGGKRRFRPIILTSFTTFFGLMPMMAETSVQARFLIPMAISLGCGVLFVTFITLVLVPSIYMIVEDIKAFQRRYPDFFTLMLLLAFIRFAVYLASEML